MTVKIMYIPLDERPCNYVYPRMISDIGDYKLLVPPRGLLGKKKKPADIPSLWNWLESNIGECSYLIASIDMLIYGGIVPSRIHNKKGENCLKQLQGLYKLKELNPGLKIFAYNLIMRVPAYNSADEEPEYYDDYGKDIFKYGALQDKLEHEIGNEEEKKEFEKLKNRIPAGVQEDYLQRREINHRVNRRVIELVAEGVINFLVIPMDDNSKYSFSSRERRKLKSLIEEKGVQEQISLYPGADEVGSVLTVRVFTESVSWQPAINVSYSSPRGKEIIPRLEDRPLQETVNLQVRAAGGGITDNLQEADFILLVNTPTGKIKDRFEGGQSTLNENTARGQRELDDFIAMIDNYNKKGLPCALADVAFLNGSDPELMQMLKEKGLLSELLSYGGWNTSANTLGTVIAHSTVSSYYKINNLFNEKRSRASEKFLYLRYLEDWAYQRIIRGEITDWLEQYGLNYFDLGQKSDFISGLIKKRLKEFSRRYLPGYNFDFEVYMPWNRMFEAGIKMKDRR